MKKILLSLSICGVLFANEAPEKLNNFKQSVIELTNQEITVLESHKKCINNASDKKEIKACRHVKKANMKALKEKTYLQRLEFKK